MITGMETVSTKTFYNYIHDGKVSIKPIDLPRMLRRRTKKNWKTYIPKRQKGTSIEERPKSIETREEFGHWEGDLVTGPRDGQHGAYLTLIERKTRFYYMIPITSKSSKKVYMQINKLHKFYDDNFKKIFKSITFDNGNEFARWKDIEKKPGTKEKRTTIYFGRPNKKEFQKIVKVLAERSEIQMSEEELYLEANKWELSHGGLSGRTAQQFIDYLLGKNPKEGGSLC